MSFESVLIMDSLTFFENYDEYFEWFQEHDCTAIINRKVGIRITFPDSTTMLYFKLKYRL